MITLICVGQIKEKFFREAVDEYKKRISKYTKFEIVEIDDYKSGNKDICLLKEKELILKYLNDKSYIITLEIEGKELTSIELSKKISDTLMINSNIIFIIGGSYGLHNDIKKKSNFKLSFSKMTFPHQLFRIIFIEQLYRAFKILNNESYHK